MGAAKENLNPGTQYLLDQKNESSTKLQKNKEKTAIINTIIPQHSWNQPIIIGKLAKIPVIYQIDSGAAVSLADAKLFPSEQLNNNKNKNNDQILKDVQGNIIPLRGIIAAKIQFGDNEEKIRHTFFVVEQSQCKEDLPKIILGSDFLNTHKCVLSYEKRTLTLKKPNIEIPFHLNWDKSHYIHALKMQKNSRNTKELFSPFQPNQIENVHSSDQNRTKYQAGGNLVQSIFQKLGKPKPKMVSDDLNPSEMLQLFKSAGVDVKMRVGEQQFTFQFKKRKNRTMVHIDLDEKNCKYSEIRDQTEPEREKTPQNPNDAKQIGKKKDARIIQSLENNKKLTFQINGHSPKIGENLSITNHNKVIKMLQNYRKVFIENESDFCALKTEPVKLRLKDTTPWKPKFYVKSEKEKKVMDAVIDRLIRLDIIEKCETPYVASSCFLQRKPGKPADDPESYRILTDMRDLNARLCTPLFVGRTVDEIHTAIAGKKYLFLCDQKDAFFSVKLDKSSRKWTCFHTHSGRFYEYKRLPQGASVSPFEYNRIITTLLQRIPEILSYLDDLVWGTDDFETGLQILKNLLELAQQTGIRFQAQKMRLFMDHAVILGKKCSANGIELPDDSKNAILSMEKPQNITQLRSFLGCVGWFNTHIPNYAQKTAALRIPLQGNPAKMDKIQWNEKMEQAFINVKNEIANSQALRPYDPENKDFIITDACQNSFAAIYGQTDRKTNKKYIVKFISRTCTTSDPATILELRAILFALQKLNHFLFGRQVDVYTDHVSLTHLKNFRSPNPRLQRLYLAVNTYPHLSIHHVSGKKNALADWYSRNPIKGENEKPFSDNELWTPSLAPPTNQELIKQVDIMTRSGRDTQQDLGTQHINNPTGHEPLLQEKQFMEILLKDRFYLEIKAILQQKTRSNTYMRKQALRYELDPNGKLYYRFTKQGEVTRRLFIPFGYREILLRQAHDSENAAHLSEFYVKDKLKNFFWKSMGPDITKYTRSCEICQQVKSQTKKAPGLLEQPDLPNTPFHKLVIDFWGPVQWSEKVKKWAFVAVDAFSRFFYTRWTKDVSAKSVIECLDEFSTFYQKPREIQSDNGTGFIALELKNYCEQNGIKQRFSAIRKPSSQGAVERVNKKLKAYFSTFIKQNEKTDYQKLLRGAMKSFNSTISKTTQYSPNYLVFGQDELLNPNEPQRSNQGDKRLPNLAQARNEALENHEKSFATRATQYNKNRSQLHLRENDLVLIKTDVLNAKKRKFDAEYCGPFKIIKRTGINNYQILYTTESQPGGKIRNFHSSQIKPYKIREALQDESKKLPIRE